MKNKTKKNFLHWIGIALTLVLTTVLINENASFLNASILPVKMHKPFDGFVAPIKKVPNWSIVSGAEREKDFDAISPSLFIDLPEYEPSMLDKTYADLKYGDEADNSIRNAKITYSVPYLGNYKLDNSENSGSHPAIDIKVPRNTPIYAISNGIVAKVSTGSSGFGHTVVVKHINFPTLDDDSRTHTIYSSYSHMGDIKVSVGDIVEKNQLIAYSSDTGTATTPHLHFQIDNSSAPWHPYWPFTYKEATDNGLDFWSAINAGLGKERAQEMTINPMRLVQKYESFEPVVEPTVEATVEATPAPTPAPTVEATPAPTPTPTVEATPAPTPTPTVEATPEPTPTPDPVKTFDVSTEEFTLIENNFYAYVTALDQENKVMVKTKLTDNIDVEIEDQVIATVNRNYLSDTHFSEGTAKVTVIPKSVGKTRIMFSYNDRTFYSSYFSVIEKIKPADSIIIKHDGSFKVGAAETLTLILLDENGEETPETPLGTVNLYTNNDNGYFSPNNFSFNLFREGKVEVEYVGNKQETVEINASGGSIYGNTTIGAQAALPNAVFTDVKSSHPYFKSIKYLKENNIVNGYTIDNSFKPEREIKRAELLKIILDGFEFEIAENYNIVFSDVAEDSWYAKYIATAARLGFVSGYSDGTFKPDQTINRIEFLKILFKSKDINVDPVVINNSYLDVDKLEWYAPYVQYSMKKNLFPMSGNKFYPNKGVTRGEAAEAVYRLLMVIEGDLEKYDG